MYIMIYKTIIIYFIVLLLLRVMGKREMGQLSPFDFVVAIMIAELAVFPIEDSNINIIEGISPIIVLVILEIIIAFISLKSNYLRGILTGRPEILIKGGQINYKTLKKTRYNINDLLMQLRLKEIFNIDQVDLAILEPSGELSVVKKDDDNYGFPVLIDTKFLDNESLSGVSKNWVEKQLRKKGVRITDLVLVTVDKNKEIKLYYKE